MEKKDTKRKKRELIQLILETILSLKFSKTSQAKIMHVTSMERRCKMNSVFFCVTFYMKQIGILDMN